MIIDVYTVGHNKSVVTAIIPENKTEEDIIRNAKILHKNNLLVWWGDALELEHQGKFLGYSGLKISYDLPKEDRNVVSTKG